MAELRSHTPGLWEDLLSPDTVGKIKTSPLYNGLARYFAPPQRTMDQYAREKLRPGDPIERIAEGQTTLGEEYPERGFLEAWFGRSDAHQQLGTGLNVLANFIGPGGVKLPVKPAASAPAQAPIRAYHGSPHDFDKFDLSKIGTGEGRQAFGRGLYGLLPTATGAGIAAADQMMSEPGSGSAEAIFAGPKAKTAPLAALTRAQQKSAQGVPREQIWKDEGWFQGPDKKWRFEIDDRPARFTFDELSNGHSSPLGGALSHDKLFSAYPDLNTAKFQWRPDGHVAAGSYLTKSEGGGAETINLRGAIPSTRVGMHEVQHAVQNREGFAVGSNPNRITSQMMDDYGRSLPPNRTDAYEIQTPGGKAMDVYKAHAGEVEARAVEKRLNLTPEQRRARPPWLDYDVPEHLQIVREK